LPLALLQHGVSKLTMVTCHMGDFCLTVIMSGGFMSSNPLDDWNWIVSCKSISVCLIHVTIFMFKSVVRKFATRVVIKSLFSLSKVQYIRLVLGVFTSQSHLIGRPIRIFVGRQNIVLVSYTQLS